MYILAPRKTSVFYSFLYQHDLTNLVKEGVLVTKSQESQTHIWELIRIENSPTFQTTNPQTKSCSLSPAFVLNHPP